MSCVELIQAGGKLKGIMGTTGLGTDQPLESVHDGPKTDEL